MANDPVDWRQRVLQAIPFFPGEAQDESSWTPGYIRLASCGYSLLQALPHLDIVSGFTADDRPDPRPILPTLFEKVTSDSDLTAAERRAYAFWAAGHFLNAAQSRIAAALDAIINNFLLRFLPSENSDLVDELLHLYSPTRLHILLATWSVPKPLASQLESLSETFHEDATNYRKLRRRLKECNFDELTLDAADAWDTKHRPTPTSRPSDPHADWQAVLLCCTRCNAWKHLPNSSHEARLVRPQVHFTDWIWAYRGFCTLSRFWQTDAAATMKKKGDG